MRGVRQTTSFRCDSDGYFRFIGGNTSDIDSQRKRPQLLLVLDTNTLRLKHAISLCRAIPWITNPIHSTLNVCVVAEVVSKYLQTFQNQLNVLCDYRNQPFIQFRLCLLFHIYGNVTVAFFQMSEHNYVENKLRFKHDDKRKKHLPQWVLESPT